jgi:leucine-rich repeat protein SHOC2
LFKKILITVLLSSTCPVVSGQNEFDMYGPPGSLVYKDLKEVMRVEKKVYKIDLSYQKIDQKLYEKLGKITDLQVLRLSTNELTEYPRNFEALFNLVYFASYNNKFTAFPPDMRSFSNLHYLELQHTAIDSIPAKVAYLNKLRSFKFGNTEDTLKLPLTLRFLRNLKDLSIENCVMDSFPKQIFKLSGLIYLNLSNTNTWFLSKHFERLQNLEVLIVENNHLTEIPFDIYKAYKLRFISFRGNQLRKLPVSISHLENLTLLDLRGNNFTTEEIEELKALLPGCEIKS